MLFEQRRFSGRHLDRDGIEQVLHGDMQRGLVGHELFVQYPFMRRVLIDQIHTVRPFGDDVHGANLADDAQRRQLDSGRWKLARGSGLIDLGRGQAESGIVHSLTAFL